MMLFLGEVKSLSCVRLFATMDYSLTKLLCPWDFPGKSTGVYCHFLLQGIFPTQGSNPGLPHCGQTLNRLSHQGSGFRRNSLEAIPNIYVLYIITFVVISSSALAQHLGL